MWRTFHAPSSSSRLGIGTYTSYECTICYTTRAPATVISRNQQAGRRSHDIFFVELHNVLAGLLASYFFFVSDVFFFFFMIHASQLAGIFVLLNSCTPVSYLHFKETHDILYAPWVITYFVPTHLLTVAVCPVSSDTCFATRYEQRQSMHLLSSVSTDHKIDEILLKY